MAMPFPEKLRAARIAAGFTSVPKLAAALDVSASTVSEWERGANKPTADRLVEIGRVVRVPLDWLLDDSRAEPAEVAREVHQILGRLGYAEVRRRAIVYDAPGGPVLTFHREPKKSGRGDRR